MEENERLKRELELALERAKNSKNEKFIAPAGLKGGGNDEQENNEPNEQVETESQRKQRERFERLEMNAKGASIR